MVADTSFQTAGVFSRSGDSYGVLKNIMPLIIGKNVVPQYMGRFLIPYLIINIAVNARRSPDGFSLLRRDISLYNKC